MRKSKKKKKVKWRGSNKIGIKSKSRTFEDTPSLTMETREVFHLNLGETSRLYEKLKLPKLDTA